MANIRIPKMEFMNGFLLVFFKKPPVERLWIAWSKRLESFVTNWCLRIPSLNTIVLYTKRSSYPTAEKNFFVSCLVLSCLISECCTLSSFLHTMKLVFFLKCFKCLYSLLGTKWREKHRKKTFVLLPENLHTYFELSGQAWTLYKAP